MEFRYLCKSIAILESETDPHGWGNAIEDELAFLLYMGFHSHDLAIAYKNVLMKFSRCPEVVIRPARRMVGFAWELKAYGMPRYTCYHSSGLDDLVESVKLRELVEKDPVVL